MSLKLDNRKLYRVLIDNDGVILANKCRLATDFFSRLKGLMFKNELPQDEALLIVPCNSIHTFFMKFPIDVVFINNDGIALKTVRNMEPGRIVNPIANVWATLELRGGSLNSLIGENRDISGKKIRFEES